MCIRSDENILSGSAAHFTSGNNRRTPSFTGNRIVTFASVRPTKLLRRKYDIYTRTGYGRLL